MNIPEAKKIIREDTPEGNAAARIEAIHVALCVLGETATMSEIYRWAEETKES